MNVQEWKDITGTALQILNLIILCYGGYKFMNKPHDSLVEEVKALKEEIITLKLVIEKMQDSLNASHDKHREQDKTNKVFKKVFILLANFEVAYCQETGFEHTDDLEKAKRELEDYLIE